MPECPRCDTPIVFEGLEGKCPNIPFECEKCHFEGGITEDWAEKPIQNQALNKQRFPVKMGHAGHFAAILNQNINPLDVEGLWQGTSGLIKDSDKPKILVEYRKMRQEENRNCRHRQFPVREVADNNLDIYKYKCLECDYYLSLKEFQKGSLGSRNAIMFCGICGRNWHIPCSYSEEDEEELGMELDRLLDASRRR